MKRPAAAPDNMKPTKKMHQVDPLEQMCSAISASVMEATHVTCSAREMLSSAVPHSLAVFKSERHIYQEEMVGMIEDALVGIESDIKQKISDADVKLVRRDEEQVARAANLEGAKIGLEKSQSNLAQTEKVHAENMHNLSKAEQAVREVATAESERLLERDAIQHKKEQMEAVEKDCLIPLKEGSVETQPQIKKKINSLVSMGKSMQLDGSLLLAFPGVLAKVPTERGNFDVVILQQLEEVFSKRLIEIEEQLESLLPALGEHEAAVQAAKDLLTQAHEKCKASEESVKSSSARNLECEEILRSAEQAIQSLESEFEAIVVTRNDALEQLAAFQSSSLSALRELKERTKEDINCKNEVGTITDHSASVVETTADGQNKIENIA